MQATMSYGYSHGYNAHTTFYEPPLDTRAIMARYATSSCRDEPPHDPTAPKYDPLHILSPLTPIEQPEAVYHPMIILVTTTKTPIDHKCTPRDPRAICMAMSDPPRTLAWAQKQGHNQQSIWALSALSCAQYPQAVNYAHYWGANARDATAAFVCGAMAHGLMRLEPTDPPVDSPAELVADVLRALAEYQDASKPAVAEGTRASTRIARQNREADQKKRGSPHAPAVSSPLAQSMLLPPADIDMASEITRTAPRPAKKSKLARDAASVSADEAEPSSSASSDGTLVSSSAGSAKATRKRSRSGSASSSATTVDVVGELEGEQPVKKRRRKTPEGEAAGTPGEAAGKPAKAPKKRATKKR